MKITLITSLVGITAFLCVLFWAAYPWSIDEKPVVSETLFVETAKMVEEKEDKSVIKILTWNLGFLYGKGSEGPGYEHRDKEYYEERLKKLVQEIEDWQPDIICLQEVDFDSHRSYGINQAHYLAEKAGYPYLVEAPSWEANYIPFPYWPIKDQFGSMNSGGAILSRYPLTHHEYLLLRKPPSHPWWYNLFYLHRYFQTVTVEVGKKSFKLVNLHLEAFDKKDREGQVRHLIKKAQAEKVDFMVGDFNMLPEAASRKNKLQGGDSYENDKSFLLMSKSGYSEVIPEQIYSLAESSYFTFPAERPDRRLDYIFYRRDLKMMKAEVLPSALSDHLPLRASFQIDSPHFNLYSL